MTSAKSGRRRDCCAEDLLEFSRLGLNHTEAKKGRGNPKITKLGYLDYYRVHYLYCVESGRDSSYPYCLLKEILRKERKNVWNTK